MLSALLCLLIFAIYGCGSGSSSTEKRNLDIDETSFKQTPSGLQYLIVKEGTGDRPAPGDEVTINYTGLLMDGTVFQESDEESLIFKLGSGNVLKGIDEGVQLISPGGRIRLIIPPALAYGERGAGKVPPNSTIVFDIELLKVEL